MKILSAALLTALTAAPAALALTLSPTASANGDQDTAYVACVGKYGIYSHNGPGDLANLGASYARDIDTGYRSAAAEAQYVFEHTPPSISHSDSNVLVNCATEVWLNFGPPGWNGVVGY